jgi:hypothetical protein
MRGEGIMEPFKSLDALREDGKLEWSSGDRAWWADPGDVVDALAHDGFQEYKHEVMRSRIDRAPAGGVWQGLDRRTGAVASAIWVARHDAPPLVFIDIDGEALRGDQR